MAIEYSGHNTQPDISLADLAHAVQRGTHGVQQYLFCQHDQLMPMAYAHRVCLPNVRLDFVMGDWTISTGGRSPVAAEADREGPTQLLTGGLTATGPATTLRAGWIGT